MNLPLHRRLSAPVFLALCLFFSAVVAAQEEARELALASVSVDPQTVRADTLCKLSIELTNSGDRTADAFAFDVSVGGVKLDVYDRQLFLDPVPAGETRRLQLFNFWSNESGRELPTEGPLRVEVKLREARWVSIEEGEAEQVWSALESVAGLPQTVSVSVDVER